MHTVNNNVRKMAKAIVVTFSQHLKARMDANDVNYVSLDIDRDFSSYASLFKIVAGKLLNVTTDEVNYFPDNVVDEILTVLKESLKKNRYSYMLESSILSECVFKVCMFILRKVKDEVFGESDNVLVQ